MKNLIIILLAILLFSCSKEGDVLNRSTQHIKINGNEYYFMKIVPADGERGVWLLVPKDANIELPEVMSYNYTVYCGKSCYHTRSQECILVKS